MLGWSCQRPEKNGEAIGSAGTNPPASGSVVDSILPIEEEIRRFQELEPDVATGLTGGEPSRDALVRRWVSAVERADTADIRAMLITPAEFITFYYPDSRYVRPPYRQSPRLLWFLMASQSSQGATRVMQRHGGAPFGFVAYACSEPPDTVGSVQVWGACLIRREPGAGGANEMRFFGGIIERNGTYKFLSYASDY